MPQSEDIILLFDRLSTDIKIMKKQPGDWWEKLDKIVSLTVQAVERLDEKAKGEDKKRLATEVILGLWFKNFNIKWLPDFLEKPMARKLVVFLVDKLIEATVSLLNRTNVFRHASQPSQ